MSIEEKAKAYDEALKWMRDLYPELHGATKEDAEHYFPELRESEDERIRKALVWHLKAGEDFISNGVTKEECITYLEKQKDAFENGRQLGIMQEQARQELEWPDEKQKEQKHYWKPTQTDVALFNKAVTTNKILTPVERAQLDIIRSKFSCCRATSCGGIVQEEQKEESLRDFIDNFPYSDEHKEQKSTVWTEEDERMKEQLINICNEWLNGGWSAKPCLNDVRWLKNLLEKQKEQKPTEWSEEDKEMLDSAIKFVEHSAFSTIGKGKNNVLAWLKSLPERFNLQPKQEWSEEDEAYRNFILESLEDQIRFCKKNAEGAYYAKQIRTAQNWLKSHCPSCKSSNQDELMRLKYAGTSTKLD